MIKERFDRSDKQYNDHTDNMRVITQRLAGLEHEARQPRLAPEVDVEPDTKTRKRTEGASVEDPVKNGDSFSAKVEDDPTSLTSFGMTAEPPGPEKCIGDVLANKGAEASEPYLPSMEVRMLSSAAGRLLPAGTASTATRAVFPRPLFSWSLSEKIKEGTGRTSFNQLAPPSWRKVIQTKSR